MFSIYALSISCKNNQKMAGIEGAINLLESVTEGCSSHQLFGEKKTCYAYTFDDVIVLPGHMNFDVEDGMDC